MRVSDTDLEVHFKRITHTHAPFSSIQRTAKAYLFSFMGILFITGQALYKEIGYLSCVNLNFNHIRELKAGILRASHFSSVENPAPNP